jgi:hypothetical protein
MKNIKFFSLATLIMIAYLLATCAPGKYTGTPQPVGATVEVGGFWKAETSLKAGHMITQISISGKLQDSGWQVKVLSVESPVGTIRIKTQITNSTDSPGAIDLLSGPKLVDSQGNAIIAEEVNLANYQDAPFTSTGSASAAANCMFSAPDKDFIQQADCEAVLYGTDKKVLLSIGAAATVEIIFIYPTPLDTTALTLQWLDGTLFTVP